MWAAFVSRGGCAGAFASARALRRVVQESSCSQGAAAGASASRRFCVGRRTGLAPWCLHRAGPGAFVSASHGGIHGAKIAAAASALRCRGVRVAQEAARFELAVLGSSAGVASEAGASALRCSFVGCAVAVRGVFAFVGGGGRGVALGCVAAVRGLHSAVHRRWRAGGWAIALA